MNAKPSLADSEDRPDEAGTVQRSPRVAAWERFPTLPVLLTFVLAAFVLCPPVRQSDTLVTTFLGVGAVMLVWALGLWARGLASGRTFAIERVAPQKSHYIQGTVQLCIYAYWASYWPEVGKHAPLIVAQLVFLYVLDGLLSWSRGRAWRLGFGPLPIILSTNIFIWFKDDWFVYQFVLIALAALGKEFIKWEREGRRTHIFNPSAFALCVVSIVLIFTNTTHLTWGIEIAATLTRPPHIYLEIFLLGLVVQYFFGTTLMTLSAVAALVVLDRIWFGATGTYHFIDTNIPIAVFLGLHLLVTDPSTSPRTNAGKIVFGTLYGAANFGLYFVLEHYQQPEFYDKLLPVPILNLSVQWIDRMARSGVLGAFSAWEKRFSPRATNLAYMGGWTALFVAMLTTGYVEAPHQGASLAFWKQAYAEGKPNAGQKLLKLAGAHAQAGSPSALNELGVLYMRGEVVKKDRAAAAHHFASACERGDADGCANVATQFLFLREARSDRDVAMALDRLERSVDQCRDGRTCYLVGFAYETGRGRPMDKQRAAGLYERGRRVGNREAIKGVARLALSGQLGAYDLAQVARELEKACDAGDAESCTYLGLAHRGGYGVPRDLDAMRVRLQRACDFGSAQACDLLRSASAPQVAMPNLTQAVTLPSWRQ